MAGRMVWNNELGRMVEVGGKAKTERTKVSLDTGLASTLTDFAREDGFDFRGVSFVTEKGADGKTKKDKDGKPIFAKDKDGKPKKIEIAVSVEKVNSAISQYVEVAVRKLIAERSSKQ